MKRVSNLLIAVGIILSLFAYIRDRDWWLLVNFLIPYVAAIIGLRQCIRKKFIFPLLFVVIGATLYNLLYFAFTYSGSIDLYDVPWRIFVQLFIPLVIGLIIQWKREKM